VLPVPKKFGKDRDNDIAAHNKLPKHLGVARAGHYHAAVGFCDWPTATPLTEWRAE